MNITALRTRHKEIRAEMQTIDEALRASATGLDQEQNAKFDALEVESEEVSANIRRLHALQATDTAADTLMPALTTRSGPPINGGGVRQLIGDGKLFAIRANGRAWLIPYVEVQRYKEKPYTVGRPRKRDHRR